MIRLTRVETDVGEVIADSRVIVCRSAVGEGATSLGPEADRQAASSGLHPNSSRAPRLQPALAWIVDAALLILETLGTFVGRLLCFLIGAVVVPLLHELACMVGAVLFCSVGWTIKMIAAGLLDAGCALCRRSFLLTAGLRAPAPLGGKDRQSAMALAPGEE